MTIGDAFFLKASAVSHASLRAALSDQSMEALFQPHGAERPNITHDVSHDAGPRRSLCFEKEEKDYFVSCHKPAFAVHVCSRCRAPRARLSFCLYCFGVPRHSQTLGLLLSLDCESTVNAMKTENHF